MKPKLLFFGTGDLTKPRPRILLNALQEDGYEVHLCQAHIWTGVADKSQVKGARSKLWILLKWLLAYPALIVRYAFAPDHDAVIIGYPGVLDVFVLYPLARLRRKKIIWDMFMSLYDTIVLDRRLWKPTSLKARLLFRIEQLALRLVDGVFLDTHAHARRVERLFALPADSLGAVWVGAEQAFFDAAGNPSSRSIHNSSPQILFYGQFIPLHGIDCIIAAARLLQNQEFTWLIVGKGQEAPRIDAMLAEFPLPRVKRIDWLPYEDLPQVIRDSDVCLGIFGSSEKAKAVIPNKVFQMLAVGKSVLTMDSPAMRELQTQLPDPEQVMLVQPEPAALAAAITQIMSDEVSVRPYEPDALPFSSRKIAAMFQTYLERC